MRKAAKVYEAGESVEGNKPKVVFESHKKCTPGEFGMHVKAAFEKSAIPAFGGRNYSLAPRGFGLGLNAGYDYLGGVVPAPYVGVDIGTPHTGVMLSGPIPGIGFRSGMFSRPPGATSGHNRNGAFGHRSLWKYLFDSYSGRDPKDVEDEVHDDRLQSMRNVTKDEFHEAIPDYHEGPNGKPLSKELHKALTEYYHRNSRPEKQSVDSRALREFDAFDLDAAIDNAMKPIWQRGQRVALAARAVAPPVMRATGNTLGGPLVGGLGALGSKIMTNAVLGNAQTQLNGITQRQAERARVQHNSTNPPPGAWTGRTGMTKTQSAVEFGEKVAAQPWYARALSSVGSFMQTPNQAAQKAMAAAKPNIRPAQWQQSPGLAKGVGGFVADAKPMGPNPHFSRGAIGDGRAYIPLEEIGAMAADRQRLKHIGAAGVGAATALGSMTKTQSAHDFGEKVAFNLSDLGLGNIDWNALKTPALGGAALGAGLGGLAGLVAPGTDEKGNPRSRFGAMLRGALGGGAVGGLGGAAVGHFAPGMPQDIYNFGRRALTGKNQAQLNMADNESAMTPQQRALHARALRPFKPAPVTATHPEEIAFPE